MKALNDAIALGPVIEEALYSNVLRFPEDSHAPYQLLLFGETSDLGARLPSGYSPSGALCYSPFGVVGDGVSVASRKPQPQRFVKK